MKEHRYEMRMEPAVKRYLIAAARKDHRTLSSFMIKASLEKAEAMRADGWVAKDPPKPKDERFKKKARAA